ncbi:MAG: hypothetical protein ACFFAJ_15135 [Candidatus Hodarchaeota archaeon]
MGEPDGPVATYIMEYLKAMGMNYFIGAGTVESVVENLKEEL